MSAASRSDAVSGDRRPARPAALARFDGLGERFLADVETLKEDGGLVVGVYCAFAPTELIRAAGAVPVGLCGKKQAPIPEAEKTLPANLCPLVKSSYGYAVTDTCPYFAASDLLVGETTCDGKKKMFELLGRLKPMRVMRLPTSQEPADLAYWEGELRRLADWLTRATGRVVTDDALVREIRLQNEVRRLLKRVAAAGEADAPPLSGLDMMAVMEAKSFVADLESYAADLRVLLGELEATGDAASSDRPGAASRRAEAPVRSTRRAPRLLLTGCPVGRGSEKIIRLTQECGGLVVCQETCTGLKSFDRLTDETGDSWSALARRYLATPCSCLSPNAGRFELVGRLARRFRADGVIDLTWQCCHAYNIESHPLRRFVEGELGLPMLHVETDYAESDAEQLRTRVEAFLEML